MTDPLAKLYRRPGFLVRRAHQIAVSLFLEETRELGVTNTQYGILFVLKHHPGTDQATLARLLGLDRSTTGMVLKKLEGDRLVGRVVGARDRRTRSLALTPEGDRMLARLAAPARRAQSRVLSALAPAERKLFLDLLDKLTRRFNGSVRAPLRARDNLRARPRAGAQSTRMSSRAKPATRL